MAPNECTGEPRRQVGHRRITICADLSDGVAVAGWAATLGLAATDTIDASLALTVWAFMLCVAAAIATNVSLMGRRVDRANATAVDLLATQVMEIGIEFGRSQGTPRLAPVADLCDGA